MCFRNFRDKKKKMKKTITLGPILEESRKATTLTLADCWGSSFS